MRFRGHYTFGRNSHLADERALQCVIQYFSYVHENSDNSYKTGNTKEGC